jgi:hypothetical protein
MRDFEKHRMKGMYPAKTKLYLEKRGEKRRIAEDIKRGISAYKRSNVQEQGDQEAIVQAADDNPNDIQGEDEMFQFGEYHWHEKSDIQEDQCHEESDFGGDNSSPKSDCSSEKSDFGEEYWSETSEETHADNIEDDSALKTGSLYRTILQEHGIDKVCYQYGEALTDDEYDVWHDAVDLVEDLDKADEALNEATSDFIYDGSPITTKLFAQMFIEFGIKNFKSAKANVELMLLLNYLFPKDKGFNLPIRLSRKSNYKSTVSDNSNADLGVLQYDTCENRCMVYAFDHLNSTCCQSCKKERKSTRINKYTVSYRPLTVIFYRLLSTSGFLHAINYCTHGHSSRNHIRDVQEGENFKKHWKDMDSNYDRILERDNTLVKVNLLLSEFHDGIQVTSSKYIKFAPLIISILNLPPTYRSNVGVGSFLSFINLDKGKSSNIEKFLFQCLVDELKRFYKGVIMCVKGVNYFVQARLIMHVGDTKELEHLLKMNPCANSFDGCCFCDFCTGLTYSIFYNYIKKYLKIYIFLL